MAATLPPGILIEQPTPTSTVFDRYLSAEGRRIGAAIAELRPTIRAQAAQAEQQGRLSDELIAEFTRIGLYRVTGPVEYGGLALGARDVAEIARELGRGDASAGWTFLVASSLRMVSTFPKELVEDLYRAVDTWQGPLAAGGSTFAAVTGTARRVPRGWMVKGKWSFASGNHHANWIFGGVQWTDGDDSGHGLVMMEPSDLTRLDDWSVSGMSASDSNTMVATEEFFVPDAHFVNMRDLPLHIDSASSRYGGLAYQAKVRGSMMTVMVLNVAILIGMAQGCFELFVEQANSRKPFSPPYPLVAEMASTQVAAGKARAMIDAAETVVLRYADWIDQVATEGGDFTAADESVASIDMSYVGQLCLDAMDLMLRILGSSAVSLSNPIQRFGRDGRVILSHGALRLEPLSEIAGRHLLGLPPFDMFAAGLQNKA
ncbi:acyl-CoA dehydrogenase family protein [Nonomuraea turkmeniaca]|nr:acyl-CoA dehydrogenase family protein [Nonomuraea turkmeniaca]